MSRILFLIGVLVLSLSLSADRVTILEKVFHAKYGRAQEREKAYYGSQELSKRLELEQSSLSVRPLLGINTKGSVVAGATVDYRVRDWLVQGRYNYEDGIENLYEAALLFPLKSDRKEVSTYYDSLLTLRREQVRVALNREMTGALKALYANLLAVKSMDEKMLLRSEFQKANKRVSKRIGVFARNGLIPRMMRESFLLHIEDNTIATAMLEKRRSLVVLQLQQQYALAEGDIDALLQDLPHLIEQIPTGQTFMPDSLGAVADSLQIAEVSLRNRFDGRRSSQVNLGPLVRFDFQPKVATFGVSAAVDIRKRTKDETVHRATNSSTPQTIEPIVIESVSELRLSSEQFGKKVDRLIRNLMKDITYGNTGSFYMVLDFSSRQLDQQLRFIDLEEQESLSKIDQIQSVESFSLSMANLVPWGVK